MVWCVRRAISLRVPMVSAVYVPTVTMLRASVTKAPCVQAMRVRCVLMVRTLHAPVATVPSAPATLQRAPNLPTDGIRRIRCGTRIGLVGIPSRPGRTVPTGRMGRLCGGRISMRGGRRRGSGLNHSIPLRLSCRNRFRNHLRGGWRGKRRWIGCVPAIQTLSLGRAGMRFGFRSAIVVGARSCHCG